jgi:elongator complex protein 2
MKLWRRQLTDLSQDYRLAYSAVIPKPHLPNCLGLSALPQADDSKVVLLVLGGVDARIHLKTLLLSESQPSVSCANVGVLGGHEDWITCLSFCAHTDSKTLYIASGSQDSKIRFWRLVVSKGAVIAEAKQSASAVALGISDLSSDSEADDEDAGPGAGAGAGAAPPEDDEDGAEARCQFAVGEDSLCSVYLEALLVGHEEWVTSVQWMEGGAAAAGLRLFSTSMDRNMLIWQPEPFSGVWVPVVRIGDIGGTLGGSVGANLLGFIGGLVLEGGRRILGVGYGGSFHMWEGGELSSSGASDPEGQPRDESSQPQALMDYSRWRPAPFPTGHFGPVRDICWAADGSYLVSASSDQTCRVFGRILPAWRPRGLAAGGAAGPRYWREVSRPQVRASFLDLLCASAVFMLLVDGILRRFTDTT